MRAGAGHRQGVSLRHTAGGIAATVAVILVPGILLSPGWSLLVPLAWPAAAPVVAAVLITRRDA